MKKTSDIQKLCNQELAQSRKIAFDNAEIIPRFTLLGGSENTVILLQLADELNQRLKALQTIKILMIHQKASSFLMAAESQEPNALVCSYISNDEPFTIYQHINRNPFKQSPDHISFGQIDSLSQVDPVFLELIPPPGAYLTERQTELAEQLIKDCTTSQSDLTEN